ncbi:hypothetical protein RND81_05G089300 [Saponaria officinalis]|uniref:Uncharacterized protein n=1 Tax=Saponaria officinalis TaxID=3572 RepID=A0AAW1KW82_SAPOF
MFLLNDLITSSTTSQLLKSMDILEDQCNETTKTLIDFEEFQPENASLLAEMQSLKQSNEILELRNRESEEKIMDLRLELDDAQKKNIELAMGIEEVLIQRDFLKSEIFAVQERVREKEAELSRKIEVGIYEGMRENGELDVFKVDFSRGFEVLRLIKECLIRVYVGLEVKELGKRVDHESSFECEWEEWKRIKNLLEGLDFVLTILKRIEEKLSAFQEKSDLLKKFEDCKTSISKGFEIIGLVNASLVRICEGFNVEKVECEFDEEMSSFEDGLDFVMRTVKRVEHEVSEYQEKVKKEKRELERSVSSLTEENRDINALLRIALVEKEALEKSLMKLKGGSNEQKRMPLLQFAGRSLQSIGFGFMMGGAACDEHETQKNDDDQGSDNIACSSSVAADFSSECEVEVLNLASAVENLMKKLRLEISHLRKALDESRLDSERLQSLNEKQAQTVTEQTVYIKDLEDKKRRLTLHVKELLTEIKSTEEDVERWREACELEVEAGKRVIQERDKVVAILTQELEKTRAALQVSNNKIKMKEELAQAAMAAQLAAEKSLQLADSRAIGFRERIEALTRQLKDGDSREKNSKIKVSRLCWPWQAFKLPSHANTDRTRDEHSVVRRMPEMQALFQSI